MAMQLVCSRGASVFAPCVLTPLLIFVMELSIAEGVFYFSSTAFPVLAKVVGLLHKGMWS